jgi:hypothetical protein
VPRSPRLRPCCGRSSFKTTTPSACRVTHFPGYAATNRGRVSPAAMNHTLTTIADWPAGGFRNSADRELLAGNRAGPWISVLRQVLCAQRCFDFLPAVGREAPNARKNRTLNRPIGCVDDSRTLARSRSRRLQRAIPRRTATIDGRRDGGP